MTDFSKFLVFVFALTTLSVGAAAPKVPAGYKISEFAQARGARSLAISPTGKVYVGSQEAGLVHVIENGKTQILASGLVQPNGVAWHKGDLYIAEISKLSVIRNVDKVVPGTKVKLELLKGDFPTDYHHGWKYIAVGPDGLLYIPVGAPCNVCLSPDPMYAALHRVGLDGKNLQTVARGIRNTVGFTWHPETKQLWFTDNGRDNMGDNIPPEEVNVVVKENSHYGFPFIHGSKYKDSFYYPQMPKDINPVAPVAEIQAHSAALGIIFTHNTPFAKDYPGCFLVAEHGSWNRSSKVGYQVSVGCMDKKTQKYTTKPFLTGLLNDGAVSGRPVDLKFLANGALLVSDDHSGKIWKVEKTK